MLYNGVRENIRAYLDQIGAIVIQLSDDMLLKELNVYWTDHKVIMVMTKDILMYMDRTFVSQHKKTPIYDMGLQIFRDVIVRHESVSGFYTVWILVS